jgi:hypothetical protein
MTALAVAICAALAICSALFMRKASHLLDQAQRKLDEAAQARKQARTYFSRAYETKIETMTVVRRMRDQIAARG